MSASEQVELALFFNVVNLFSYRITELIPHGLVEAPFLMSGRIEGSSAKGKYSVRLNRQRDLAPKIFMTCAAFDNKSLNFFEMVLVNYVSWFCRRRFDGLRRVECYFEKGLGCSVDVRKKTETAMIQTII